MMFGPTVPPPYEPPPDRPGGTEYELRGVEDFAIAVLIVSLGLLWLWMAMR